MIVRCGNVGNDDKRKWKLNWNLKYIWYKRDVWTVESGLIDGRMKDGIYKVWEDGKTET